MTESVLKEELEKLRAQDLYREIRVLESAGGVEAYYKGQRLLLFCGNDYLGLSRHPRVIQSSQKAAAEAGVGAGAARLISGSSRYHDRLEKKIAALKKKEKALVFSAGYLANLGTLSALAGPKDLIVMDKLCHASLIDGAKLSGANIRVFPHLNYDRCEKMLEQAAGYKKHFLVSDTIFSMDGDLADLSRLVEIKKKFDCLLILDDAHATGVLGARGGGAAEDGGWEKEIDLFTGTLSKAIGGLGGFAAGSALIIDYLINTARSFIFATALPPTVCAAAYESLLLIEEEPALRHQLWKNIQRLHQELTALKLLDQPIQSPIFPLILGEEKEALRVSKELLKQGILIPAVRYPSVPKGKARLRLTVSADHTTADLEKLCSALRRTK